MFLTNQVIISSGGLIELVKFFAAESNIKIFKWEIQEDAQNKEVKRTSQRPLAINVSEVKIESIEFYNCQIQNAEIIKEALIDTGVISKPGQISIINCNGDLEGINKLKQDFSRIATFEKSQKEKTTSTNKKARTDQSNSVLKSGSGGLFGGSRGGLFGKASGHKTENLNSANQPGSGSLFSSIKTSTNTGLFGDANQTDNKGLFGGSNKSGGSGLFSNSKPVAISSFPSKVNESDKSLFGGNKATGGGLFGNSSESNVSSLFGRSQPTEKGGLFGSKIGSGQGLFGAKK